jgi:hypothetical protein
VSPLAFSTAVQGHATSGALLRAVLLTAVKASFEPGPGDIQDTLSGMEHEDLWSAVLFLRAVHVLDAPASDEVSYAAALRDSVPATDHTAKLSLAIQMGSLTLRLARLVLWVTEESVVARVPNKSRRVLSKSGWAKTLPSSSKLVKN